MLHATHCRAAIQSERRHRLLPASSAAAAIDDTTLQTHGDFRLHAAPLIRSLDVIKEHTTRFGHTLPLVYTGKLFDPCSSRQQKNGSVK